MNKMEERVSKGLDPLTGNPLQIVGAVRRCKDGQIRDEAGTVVDLSPDGDWVPVATNEELSQEIQRYQAIQKQSPPNSDNWQDASMALEPLFAEAAR